MEPMECNLLHLEEAESRFLIARLRLDHVLRVSGRSLMRMQFQTFPVNEIEAYSQIMQRITSKGDSKKIILRILSWIRYAEMTLRVKELQEIIWVEDNNKHLNREAINGFGVDDIIRNCESLVTCDKRTNQIKFSHATVQEFLETSRFASELMTHAALAKTCLTYLNFKVFRVPCIYERSLDKRLDLYAFSVYTAFVWAVHATKANIEDAIWSDIVDTFKQDGKRESVEQI
jgi:hypothetical protein